ncbi:MAG: hypothetical protein IJ121_07605 [Eubacterium sp.]|nr:hypothetical protein [Eubacterium sp.]
MNKDIEARNISMLTDHFLNGCKQNCIQKLGLEIEHFLIRKATGESVTYYEPHGVEWLLQKLRAHFPVSEEHNGHLIGFHNNDYAISLEPAAQIEISIAPRENPEAIRQIYLSFLSLIRPVLEQEGYELVTVGYQPVSCVDELPLIPKERYEYMDRYFRIVDTRGRNMMRGTASSQISVDYVSERDFVQKMRCAYLLMPAIKLLTDNTAVFENKPWDGWLCRSAIWNHVDRDRCGIVPGLFDPDFGFRKYAEYIWNLPLIFLPSTDSGVYGTASGKPMTSGNTGAPVYTGPAPVSELWQNRMFTPDDIDHVLSMAFPDVRLKNYIEIRGADSMPLPYVMGYLALIKGIFFHSSAVGSVTDQFENCRESDIRAAEASLMQDGYSGKIYGIPAQEFVHKILVLAESGLSASEKEMLAPMHELCGSRRTLHDH